MAARWSQRRGQHSLLLGLLKLFGIAEAFIVTEISPDVSSPFVGETKVISKMGEDVTLSCPGVFQKESFSVSWYRLNQHGPHTMIFGFSSEHKHTETEEEELKERTLLLIRPQEVALTLKNVKPKDTGTYKCILKDNLQSVERYVILQVIAPKDDDDSVVIYTMMGFIMAGLVVWMISLSILCNRGDLQCSRNQNQEI